MGEYPAAAHCGSIDAGDDGLRTRAEALEYEDRATNATLTKCEIFGTRGASDILQRLFHFALVICSEIHAGAEVSIAVRLKDANAVRTCQHR